MEEKEEEEANGRGRARRCVKQIGVETSKLEKENGRRTRVRRRMQCNAWHGSTGRNVAPRQREHDRGNARLRRPAYFEPYEYMFVVDRFIPIVLTSGECYWWYYQLESTTAQVSFVVA